MLDIRRLRMLHEFAARGSIARTAEALGYTPSAVGLQLVRSGEVEVAIVDDWTGRLAADLGGLNSTLTKAEADEIDPAQGVLSYYHLVRDPLVLVVARGHPAADPERPVN